MKSASVRAIASHFRSTPLHPQWLIFRETDRHLEHIAKLASGFVLDIGAGRQRIREFIERSSDYLAVDLYSTSVELYRHPPHVYCDASAIPLPSGTVDTVLLLDVLEHVPDIERCVREARRVIRPGGRMIIQMPFLYPLHDKPLDFRRLTNFGLHELARSCDLRVDSIREHGTPPETAALLFNLALSSMALHWMARRSPLSLLALTLPILVPVSNLLGWLFGKASTPEQFMPHGVLAVFEKPAP